MGVYKYKKLEAFIEDVNTDNVSEVSLIYTYQTYQKVYKKFGEAILAIDKSIVTVSNTINEIKKDFERNFYRMPHSKKNAMERMVYCENEIKWYNETLIILNNIKPYYSTYSLVNEKKELSERAKVRVNVDKFLVKKVNDVIYDHRIHYFSIY